jgi:hypothetical protein
MPVVQALMDKLVAQYGKDKGERVYYAMEASARGPFAKGAKHHADHEAFAAKAGVAPIAGKKKAPAPGKRGPVKAKALANSHARRPVRRAKR